MRGPVLTRMRSAVAFLALLAPTAAAVVDCGSKDKNSGGGGGSTGSEHSATAGSGHSGSGGGSAGDPDGAAPDAGSPDTGASDASEDAEQASDAASFADGGNFAGDCGVGDMGEPTSIQCTGLYSDFASKTVAADLQEYDPGLHLWSDGADKTRWIYLPTGQKIDTSDMDEWTFPVGTKIFKEFRLALGDAGTETRVETRMMWKQGPGNWYFTTYRWTDDGETDATELIGGESNVAGTTYEIPSQGECGDCHYGRIDRVMGFEAVALSTAASSGLNMKALAAKDLLSALPAKPLVIPGDINTAAVLGWLHMNCGVSCHNDACSPGSQVDPIGFYTRLDVATLATVKSTDAYTTGWNVEIDNFMIPDAGTTYLFHAGDPGSSAAYYRANIRDNPDGGSPHGVQMPPSITHEVDAVDVAALAAWIADGGN